jgi:hypothetical protein
VCTLLENYVGKRGWQTAMVVIPQMNINDIPPNKVPIAEGTVTKRGRAPKSKDSSGSGVFK